MNNDREALSEGLCTHKKYQFKFNPHELDVILTTWNIKIARKPQGER